MVSARSFTTSTFPRASAATASRRKVAFFPVASSSVKRTSGIAMARGMPGSPPPLPTSITDFASAAASGARRVRLSRMCLVHAVARSSIAVRLKRWFAS